MPERRSTARRAEGRRTIRRSLSVVVLVALSVGSTNPTWARPEETATQWYVSPSGTGSTCTSAAPCSLQTAQSKVRAATNGMSDDIVVNLASGRYELAAPLNMSAAAGDSGTGGHNVIYQAAGYGTPSVATPVLSGGTRITGWTAALGRPGVFNVDVGNLDTRQIYVDGKRAVRAAGPTGSLANFTVTATGYTSTDVSIQQWQNPGQIEFRYRAGYTGDIWLWAEPRCRIQSIGGTATQTTITMAQPCFSLTKSRIWEPDPGEPPFVLKPPTGVENSLSFLDQPGEFVLDTAPAGHHLLYYYPRAGENLSSAQVVAPVLESLVTSPATPSTPLANVKFAGITFAETTWLQPGTNVGFAETSYNMYAISTDTSRQIQAGVWLNAAANVTFERDSFTRMGGAGLTLDNGSRNNRVEGNVFADLSGNGVQIGNVDLTAAERESGPNMVADNRVANNYIHDVGQEFPGAYGIWNGNTIRTTITHNEITQLPRGGIASNFSYTNPDNFIPTGHEFSYNKVWNYMNVMADGGGFDTNGMQVGRSGTAPGSKLIGNVFYDDNNNYGQIYFDHWTSGFLVQNNLAWDSDSLDYNTISGNQDQPCCNQHRYNFYDQDNGDKFLPYTDMVVGQGQLSASAMPASIVAKAGLEAAYRDLNPRPLPNDQTPPTAPGQPSLVSLDAGPAATVKWNASSDNVGVTGYEVSNGATVVAAVAATPRTAQIEGLRPATAYTLTIRARDAAGNLSAPSTVNLTTSGSDPTLVGRWPLNQSGADVSGSRNDADVTDPTWVDGPDGKAMQFNGSTSWVGVHDSDVTNFDRGNFTLTAHFAADSAGWQRMVTNGHYGNGPGYLLQWDSGHIVFGLGGRWEGADNTAVLGRTTGTFADGEWHTVAGVVDRVTGSVKIYVDGVAQALTEPGGYCGTVSGNKININGCIFAAASSNDQLTFGAYIADDGEGGYEPIELYEGSLDDVRLYSKALTAAEIGQL